VDLQARVDQPTVIVVDDDERLRAALEVLFESIGLQVLSFGSAAELLGARMPDAPICLLLDVRLPGLNGLDLQSELGKRAHSVPIIFMTGYGDVPMTVRAMKAGAVDFLGKPFQMPDMLKAVQIALARDREQRERRTAIQRLRDRQESLTPREVQVMRYVTRGMMNKEIAAEMGIAEQTIKVHRGNLMRKMEANSVADLVAMFDKLDIPAAD